MCHNHFEMEFCDNAKDRYFQCQSEKVSFSAEIFSAVVIFCDTQLKI